MEKESFFIAQPEDVSTRIDTLLSKKYPQFSRTYFQNLIKDGLVLVNGKPIKKRIQLKAEDHVDIEFSYTDEIKLIPEDIPLNVIYEDSDIIVVNKPAGMVVHPAPGHPTKTFVNALLFHCQLQGFESTDIRPGIVHRLDKLTSGLLIGAKNRQAHAALVSQLANRNVHKRYLAIVIGSPNDQTIAEPVGRDPRNRQKMKVVEEGKMAITHIKNEASSNELSLLRVDIETGRTHQIRTHLKWLGAPILGDPVYGSSFWNNKYDIHRQMLHASDLTFEHPITGETLSLHAPMPDDMSQIVQKHFSIPSISDQS